MITSSRLQRLKCVIIFLSTLVFSLTLHAQKEFTGTYKFSTREHLKGPEYGNAVPTSIGIEHKKDSIVIEFGSMDDNNQEVKTKYAFANDGKPVTKKKTRKVVRTVKWSADKQSFTTTSEIYKEGNDDEIELTRIDDYKLSADKKQLYFHRRSVETITESWEDNATYTKN